MSATKKTKSANATSPTQPQQRRREVQRPPRLEDAMRVDGDDTAVLRQIADYYHARFNATPAAAEYLAKRGLGSPALVEHFGIGFCDQSLSTVLPQKDTKLGREVRERLVRLGLIFSGRERFLGCVVVPLFAADGTIVNLYGRRISPPASKATPIHYWLSDERGLFNAEGLAGSKEGSAILTSSIIDALTFWCAGFTNVTAARGPTSEVIEVLTHHGIDRVLLAQRGGQDHGALAEDLQRAGLVPYRVELPTGMDVNDYARKFKPAERSLALVIKKARPLIEGAPSIQVPHALVEGPVMAPAPEPTTAVPESAPPPSPAPSEANAEGDDLVMQFESRRYRVRGLRKNLSYDVLRVNLLVGRGELYFVDTLDLYSAKQRASFVKQAAVEIAVDEDLVKKDVGKVLMKLEALQHDRIRATLSPKDERPQMTSAEHEEAMALLRDPKLLDRLLADFDRCGVIGEVTNKLVAYLATLSRKLEDPLAVVVQSSSSAGKSSLMEAVLAFVPPEDVVKFSAMTPQSLFYIGETNLRHKVLAIVEEAGAERAAYALKLLQSEGELTIASTGRDAMTGKMVTEAYRVKGPTSLFLTTTRIDLDDELANRALVLAVSEDREQTRAVHRAQRKRETLDGLLHRRDKERVVRVHQNAQRLLQPIAVVNPFAEALTFADLGARTRRDHAKYLALIRVIALLHQHQRRVHPVKHDGQLLEYIEVEPSDIDTANRLAHEVLGRALHDLTPQTRALLHHLDQMAAEAAVQGVARAELRFGRREVVAFTGWSYDAVRVHLARLLERELVVLHNGGRGERHQYELLFDGSPDLTGPLLPGLIDPEALEGFGRGLEGPWTPVGVGLGGGQENGNKHDTNGLRRRIGDDAEDRSTAAPQPADPTIRSGSDEVAQ